MYLLFAGIFYKLFIAAIICYGGYKMYSIKETRAGKNPVYKKKWVFAVLIIFSLLMLKSSISEVIRFSNSRGETNITKNVERSVLKGILAEKDTVFSSTYGWKVLIPAGYSHSFSEADEALSAVKKDSILIISQQRSNLNIDDFADNKLKYLKLKDPSVVVISEEAINRSGFVEKKVSFEYVHASFGRIKSVWHFYKRNDLIIELLISCKKENANKYAPIFEQIIHSFNFDNR